LTYRELNQRSNQVARLLRNNGVRPEVLVGLYFERSLEMIVALLAVLKAGGSYLPLDATNPEERIAFMLADASPQVVMTQKNLRDRLPQKGFICLEVDRLPLDGEDSQNLATENVPDHLAYVIYTSGSTGTPKGALITHHNVVRLFQSTHRWFGFNSSDVWTLFHSYSFDFSVWEMWGALLYGGKLVIVPHTVACSAHAFWKLLLDEGITILNQTPSAFQQLIQAEHSTVSSHSSRLRLVILGGEALRVASLRPWFERHGEIQPRLVNMYGITETTVHVTYRSLTQADLGSGSVIGIPLPDLQVHLLDNHLQRVPAGSSGEIYVGGAGLARGYLNRPDLTDARFVSNPFDGNPHSRLYRSGDLARLLPNGDLEYLGRVDHQVKIHGFRVELGEIESILSQHPMVSGSLVMLRPMASGEKRLVAFVTSRQKPAPSTGELQAFIRRKLPHYMLPSAFVTLDRFPLTNHGKVDLAALPEPESRRPDLRTAYLAPRNELERTIARIWQEVLEVEGIGVEDNFFDLGGQSLQLVKAHGKLQHVLQRKIAITTLFQGTTIRSLAEHLSRGRDSSGASAGTEILRQRVV